jgi:hypothetical protein
VGGLLWAVVAFLGIALVRVSLELQALRRNHSELKRLLSTRGAAFGYGEFEKTPDSEPTPHSEVRPLRTATAFREKLASQA